MSSCPFCHSYHEKGWKKVQHNHSILICNNISHDGRSAIHLHSAFWQGSKNSLIPSTCYRDRIPITQTWYGTWQANHNNRNGQAKLSKVFSLCDYESSPSRNMHYRALKGDLLLGCLDVNISSSIFNVYWGWEHNFFQRSSWWEKFSGFLPGRANVIHTNAWNALQLYSTVELLLGDVLHSDLDWPILTFVYKLDIQHRAT